MSPILMGFPVLVVIFALDGIEGIKRLPDTIANNPLEEMQQQAEIFQSHLKTGGLISGLIMFQVILLTLMGSNNSAREIAGERQIFREGEIGRTPSLFLPHEQSLFPGGPRVHPVDLDGYLRAEHLRHSYRKLPCSGVASHPGQCCDDFDLPRDFRPVQDSRAGLSAQRLPRRIPTSAVRWPCSRYRNGQSG